MCDFKPEFAENPNKVFYILNDKVQGKQTLRFIQPGQPDEKFPEGWRLEYSYAHMGCLFCFITTHHIKFRHTPDLYREFVHQFVQHSTECNCERV